MNCLYTTLVFGNSYIYFNDLVLEKYIIKLTYECFVNIVARGFDKTATSASYDFMFFKQLQEVPGRGNLREKIVLGKMQEFRLLKS